MSATVVVGRRFPAMPPAWTVAVAAVNVVRAAVLRRRGRLGVPTMTAAPLLTWQGSLFDHPGEPDVDPSLTGLTRIRLDATAWVDHLPGWVRSSDALFQWVVDSADWGEGEITIHGK